MDECLESKVNGNTQRITYVEENSKSWWKQMQNTMENLQKGLHDLPDEVCRRMDEKTDLKIAEQLANLKVETQKEIAKASKNADNSISNLYKWVAGLSITTLISLIMSLILKFGG